eukprot:386873-Rhodomonas_salina.1
MVVRVSTSVGGNLTVQVECYRYWLGRFTFSFPPFQNWYLPKVTCSAERTPSDPGRETAMKSLPPTTALLGDQGPPQDTSPPTPDNDLAEVLSARLSYTHTAVLCVHGC